MKRSSRVITKIPKKRPDAPGKLIGVRLQPDLLAVLDRYIKEEMAEATRPEALRAAFRDWAIGAGYLPHEEEPPEP